MQKSSYGEVEVTQCRIPDSETADNLSEDMKYTLQVKMAIGEAQQTQA